jgi:lambda family phage portal protein
MKPRLLDRIARRLGWQRTAPSRRHFDGGAISRLMMDWIRSPLSADREVEKDLLQLRGRSRDAVRNNPFARRFVRMAQLHIVGPKGIRARPANRKAGKPHDNLNDEIARGWREWGKARNASVNGRLSWLDLQHLAVSELYQSGEALFQIVLDPAHPFGIALHPIDADRLDERLNQTAAAGRNEIRYGVEVDRNGRALAYHILRQHPSDTGRIALPGPRHDVIPAEQIIHLMHGAERVDRMRGVPRLAVALRDLRHLDGAQEASLVAMRAAASSVAVVVTKDPNGEVETPDPNATMEAEPGLWRYLGVNQELQSWDPHAPSDNYADFSKSVLRALASGLGTNYAQLAGDLSDANMSSMRVGRAEEQEGWMAEQEMLIEHFCQPVYDAWLRAAALAGAIAIPQYDLSRASAVVWQPRRWTSPKPVEDIEADERRVALGVASRSMIAARDGVDLWEVWEQLKEEQEYAETEGLNVEPPRKAAGGTPNERPDDTPDDPASGDDVGSASGNGRGRGDRNRHVLRVARSAV